MQSTKLPTTVCCSPGFSGNTKRILVVRGASRTVYGLGRARREGEAGCSCAILRAKGKGQRFTWRAPHLRIPPSVALALSSQTRPKPQRAKPAHMDFDLRRHTAYSVVCMVSASVVYVNTRITTHLPTPQGWKVKGTGKISTHRLRPKYLNRKTQVEN